LTAFFLNIAVAPPIDLSPVEAALAPIIGSTRLGLGNVPILAVGNNSLRVERIDSTEVGYQGIIGGRLLVNAVVYRNQLKDFISNILPQVGTSLGRLNSSFGPYRPPSNLSPAAAAIVTSTLEGVLPPAVFAAMSNDASGAPIVALLSFQLWLGDDGRRGTRRDLCVTCRLDGPGFLHRIPFERQRPP
jgi:TonB dependent receptor